MAPQKNAKKKRKNQGDDEPEYVGLEATQAAAAQPTDLTEPNDPRSQEDVDGGEFMSQAAVTEAETVQPRPKKHRGPTKMKDIARDPSERIRVEFTELGEPCGEGSVKLSSYLGPLVREHVPVLVDDWRKIGEDRKKVLWKSVQVRCFMCNVFIQFSFFFHLCNMLGTNVGKV